MGHSFQMIHDYKTVIYGLFGRHEIGKREIE